ncbi:hypothetical protein EDD27_4545 [Nonomuraea polychroma]|uniref:GH26 domain-containing protein n=1 Tax=Nonomuraea polychroma TaxID=46176 RepID=A0A438M8C6_9ACTN|nr:hypothetical protein [Nonomuraea polychroma]RVX41938.1 hypothetical protein EDD27_4545 [Nonomuraea polychroma]
MTDDNTPSRRSILLGGAAALGAAGLGLLPAAPAAAATPWWRRGRFPGDPGNGKIVYGSSMGPQQTVPDFEKGIGTTLGCHRSYFKYVHDEQWRDMRRVALDDINNHRVPVISTKLPGPWQEVADGKHDGWLRNVAAGLGSVPGPVWFCLHHEPRGEQTPAAYRAMYKHAAPILHRFPNIAVTPILNGWIWQGGDDVEAWHIPEADLIGVDDYNPWWTYDTTEPNYRPWKTPERIWGEPIATCRRWGKPLFVAEYGVRYAYREPGRSAAWLTHAYEYALEQGLVALSYFNSGVESPNGTWVLDGERLDTFKNLIHRPESVHMI